MHKEILDMFTGASNFQAKLVSVVVEERKTSSLFISKLLPAILPSPVFVLNFNFQSLSKECWYDVLSEILK